MVRATVTARRDERAVAFAESDAVLASAARRGDLAAMEQLFKRHFRRIGGLVFRLTGDRGDVGDLTQEVFVRALESLRSLQHPEAFAAWLNAIAVRTVHKELRRRSLARVIGLPAAPGDRMEDVASTDASPEDRAELGRIYRILSRLPPRHQVALVLRRVEGHTLPEIARLMNTSLATVKRWIAKVEHRMGAPER